MERNRAIPTGTMNFLAIHERASLKINLYIPIVGFAGSLVFLPLMVSYLYTQEPGVFNAVVLLAIVVLVIEFLYFERKRISVDVPIV